MVRGWSHINYGGDSKKESNADGGALLEEFDNTKRRSAFLEEEEDSRDMEMWEYNDDISVESSAISSLSGTVGARRKKKQNASSPRRKNAEEEKVEEDVEHGEPATPLVPATTRASEKKKKKETPKKEGRFKSIMAKMPKLPAKPTVATQKKDGKSKQSERSDRHTKYFWVALGLVLVILIIIVSVVLGTRKGKGASSEGVGDVPETADDSQVLTSREQSLQNIFATISDGSLNVVDSPQYKAKSWMFREDGLLLTPSATVSNERILQRYALAVFYFSTNGPGTWLDNNWLQGDECSNMFWDGISCNDDDQVRAIAFGK